MTTDIRAVIFDGPGQPFREVVVPPPVLGAGEMLVELTMTTLCGSDLHTWQGHRTTPLPTVLGPEICGRVVDLGPEPPRTVDGLPVAPGDRVTWSIAVSCGDCFYCSHELPQKCELLLKVGHEAIAPGLELFGGLATHCRLPARSAIVKLPDAVPDAAAAPANCAVATVRAALAEAGEPDTVLLHGAGMLGLVGAAMLADLGVQVFVVEPDAKRRDKAIELGACWAGQSGETLDEALSKATAGRGADVAMDFSGHLPALAEGLARLRLGGRAVWIGAVFPAGELAIEPERLVRRNLSIRGVHNYQPRHLLEAVDWLASTPRLDAIAGLVEQAFPLAQTAEAFATAAAERPVRAAIVPD